MSEQNIKTPVRCDDIAIAAKEAGLNENETKSLHWWATHGNGGGLGYIKLIATIARLVREREEREAIIAKLPMTADGFRIVPLLTVRLWTQIDMFDVGKGFLSTEGTVRQYIDVGSGGKVEWGFGSNKVNQCWDMKYTMFSRSSAREASSAALAAQAESRKA